VTAADRPPARWFGGGRPRPVRLGLSGARVWTMHDEAGRTVRYVKAEPVAETDDHVRAFGTVLGEAERAIWLRAQGLPAPDVLDAGEDDGWQVMVTAPLPGVPMSALAGDDAITAVAAAVEVLLWLHHLPTDRCPFRRDLSLLLAGVRAAVATGRVDPTDFDHERTGRRPADLLEQAAASRPSTEDLVVCHGDACLPNLLYDPDSRRVTGLVDLGRVGIADRHADLALLTRSLADPGLNPGYGPAAAAEFLRRYPLRADPALLDYYRLLDEFF
jgi:kanamycin kinase/aminoglycoside 3'-phosphotransferase-2